MLCTACCAALTLPKLSQAWPLKKHGTGQRWRQGRLEIAQRWPLPLLLLLYCRVAAAAAATLLHRYACRSKNVLPRAHHTHPILIQPPAFPSYPPAKPQAINMHPYIALCRHLAPRRSWQPAVACSPRQPALPSRRRIHQGASSR